ncbi:MAG: CCA tRNA nucleotidyltransferase [Deltaproteobacteria bacterium]|nr:CCA tRNA nucleotidyltransferase [Deltaproteobacteria bacterium]
MVSKEKSAIRIIKTLKKHGHEAFLAGGCVRDRIRGVEPKDYDIATSAPSEEIQKLFKKTIPVGVQFGVILVVEDGVAFEVATFRTEGDYQDGRRPGYVAFASLEQDAKRRDFTVNGLYYDVEKKKIIDFVDGQRDISLKLIRTIGEPEKRFLEDHLRMMRAVRFAVQLGFEIDPAICPVIQKHAKLLSKVSQERLRDELVKTLTSPAPGRGIRLLDACGLLGEILPEVIAMKGVEQPIEYHPEGDVYTHTLMCLDGLSNAPAELAVGALLHDVGKPLTFVRAPDRIRFNNHDKVGAEMAKQICKRLAFPNSQTDLIYALVSEHLRFKDAMKMRESTLRRFLSMERIDLHMELHRLDCLASHANLDAYQFCAKKLGQIAAEPPKPVKLIGGTDLIALGFEPGPQFSKIMRAVEDAVLEDAILSKEEALEFVKRNYLKK